MEIKLDSAKVDAVVVGRILAGIVIAIAFANSIYWATAALSNGFWVFLSHLAVPLGVGFLIVVMTEIVKVIRPSKE